MKTLLALLVTASLCRAASPAFDWNSETIHCGNLVYGDNQTSVCFAETFLSDAAKQTGLNISPRFARIELAKDNVFNTPLCIFTGEGDFVLKGNERANIRRNARPAGDGVDHD